MVLCVFFKGGGGGSEKANNPRKSTKFQNSN